MNSSLKKLIRLVATVGVASSLTAIIAGRASATPPVLTDDAMIFGKGSNSQDSGSASCEGPGMFAGADGGLQIKRALVKFDVSGVPVPMGEHVEQVDLNLVIGQVAGSGGGGGGGGGCGVFCSYDPRYFSLHAVSTSKPWSQGTSGSTACSGHPCGSMGGTGQGWPHVAGDVTWASNIEGTSTWANNRRTRTMDRRSIR